MIALVDTPIWSLALRRRRAATAPQVGELTELIREGRAAIIGPIRQEVSSATRSPSQHENLRQHLRAFSDIELATDDFELAANFYNRCRATGVQGTNTDFLICAVAANRRYAIFTTETLRGFNRPFPCVCTQDVPDAAAPCFNRCQSTITSSANPASPPP